MTPSAHVRVRIDLSQVRRNATAIRQFTGVPVIAVVKADAYGLGSNRVAHAIADLVDGFYVFDLREAVLGNLAATGRRTIVLRAESQDPSDYIAHRAQPAAWDAQTALGLAAASPVLSVDTGQQRFGVPLDDRGLIEAILRAGQVQEAFTHATSIDQVRAFAEALQGDVPKLHAAGSALLSEPSARLQAVRPGLALYADAVRVCAPLLEVRDSGRPAGYSGFTVPRHGILLAGYSNGLRVGPCSINGRASRILEVGMQSAFVECAPQDRAGDEVVLLGGDVSAATVATAWRTSPQDVLLHLTAMGERLYVGP